MIAVIRKLLWRILGFDYEILLKKTDYVLLQNDKFAKIGVKTYNNGAKVWRWTEAPLKIGNFCSIAHNVNFIVDQGYHQVSPITNYPFINNLTSQEEFITIKSNIVQKQGITVGHDVWIGLNAIIMPGVAIGNGVIIAANTVVTKDVLDYSIVAGNPAELIKMKYDNAAIQKLNTIAWWSWSPELLERHTKDFYLLNIADFIDKYDKGIIS